MSKKCIIVIFDRDETRITRLSDLNLTRHIQAIRYNNEIHKKKKYEFNNSEGFCIEF